MPEREPPLTQHMNALAARQNWAKLLQTVVHKEARVVVEEHGHPVAALVSIEDLARLTTLDEAQASDSATTLAREELDAALAANRAEAPKTHTLLIPPSAAELAHRRAIATRMRANRPARRIAPLTTSDLIHEALAKEAEAYDQPR